MESQIIRTHLFQKKPEYENQFSGGSDPAHLITLLELRKEETGQQIVYRWEAASKLRIV